MPLWTAKTDCCLKSQALYLKSLVHNSTPIVQIHELHNKVGSRKKRTEGSLLTFTGSTAHFEPVLLPVKSLFMRMTDATIGAPKGAAITEIRNWILFQIRFRSRSKLKVKVWFHWLLYFVNFCHWQISGETPRPFSNWVAIDAQGASTPQSKSISQPFRASGLILC